MHIIFFSRLSAAVNSDVNRVPGQSNGEAGAGRDPLRINSGETGPGDMAGAGQGMVTSHMMSPGQEHLRQQTQHTGHQETGQATQADMTRLGTLRSNVVFVTLM